MEDVTILFSAIATVVQFNHQ